MGKLLPIFFVIGATIIAASDAAGAQPKAATNMQAQAASSTSQVDPMRQQSNSQRTRLTKQKFSPFPVLVIQNGRLVPSPMSRALSSADKTPASAVFIPCSSSIVIPPTAVPNVRLIVEKLARAAGVDSRLVFAVIAAESGFVSDALSNKNAKGLMQLTDETAARFAVVEPYDPEQNIRGGIAYLAWLLKRFAGDQTLALAAYNAGEIAVDKNKGVPPFPETQRFIARVRCLLSDQTHGGVLAITAPRAPYVIHANEGH